MNIVMQNNYMEKKICFKAVAKGYIRKVTFKS